jgi:hypothetical protein
VLECLDVSYTDRFNSLNQIRSEMQAIEAAHPEWFDGTLGLRPIGDLRTLLENSTVGKTLSELHWPGTEPPITLPNQ